MILLIGAGAGIAYASTHTAEKTLKASTVNTTIDALGLKQRVASTLASNVTQISQSTGMSEEQVSAMITDLDIQDWQAVDMPDGLTSAATFDYSYIGFDGTITTYTDPRYVSATISGQNITFEVPGSAQPYVKKMASFP